MQDPDGWRQDPYVQNQQDKREEAIARYDRLGCQYRRVCSGVLRSHARQRGNDEQEP